MRHQSRTARICASASGENSILRCLTDLISRGSLPALPQPECPGPPRNPFATYRGRVQSLPIRLVKVIPLIDRHQVDDRALRQVHWFVEHQVPVLHGCSQCMRHTYTLPQAPPLQGNPSGIPTQRGFLCFLTSTAFALTLVAYRLLAQHRGF